MRDGGDSKLAPMTAVAYGECCRQQCQQMTMVLKDEGMRELAADNDGEGMRLGERLWRQETATRDGGDRGLATMTAVAYGNCRGQGCWRMTMALKDVCMQELAADDNGEGTRRGGEKRRHSAFIRGNNC